MLALHEEHTRVLDKSRKVSQLEGEAREIQRRFGLPSTGKQGVGTDLDEDDLEDKDGEEEEVAFLPESSALPIVAGAYLGCPFYFSPRGLVLDPSLGPKVPLRHSYVLHDIGPLNI